MVKANSFLDCPRDKQFKLDEVIDGVEFGESIAECASAVKKLSYCGNQFFGRKGSCYCVPPQPTGLTCEVKASTTTAESSIYELVPGGHLTSYLCRHLSQNENNLS